MVAVVSRSAALHSGAPSDNAVRGVTCPSCSSVAVRSSGATGRAGPGAGRTLPARSTCQARNAYERPNRSLGRVPLLDPMAEPERVGRGARVRVGGVGVLDDLGALVVDRHRGVLVRRRRPDPPAGPRRRQAPALPAEHRLVDVDGLGVVGTGVVVAEVPWMKPSLSSSTISWSRSSVNRVRRECSECQVPACSSHTSTRIPRVTSSVASSSVSSSLLRNVASYPFWVETRSLLAAPWPVAGHGQAGGAEGGVGGVDVVAVLLHVLDPRDRPEEPVGLERAAVGVDVDAR